MVCTYAGGYRLCPSKQGHPFGTPGAKQSIWKSHAEKKWPRFSDPFSKRRRILTFWCGTAGNIANAIRFAHSICMLHSTRPMLSLFHEWFNATLITSDRCHPTTGTYMNDFFYAYALNIAVLSFLTSMIPWKASMAVNLRKLSTQVDAGSSSVRTWCLYELTWRHQTKWRICLCLPSYL
jgi:hypothetical protein